MIYFSSYDSGHQTLHSSSAAPACSVKFSLLWFHYSKGMPARALNPSSLHLLETETNQDLQATPLLFAAVSLLLHWLLSLSPTELEMTGRCQSLQAEIRTSFEDLYRMMSQREEFRWMMLRIKRMAEPWVGAIRSLAAKQNLGMRRRKKVCVYACLCSGALLSSYSFISFFFYFFLAVNVTRQHMLTTLIAPGLTHQ